jgi:hypothetical protein
VEGVAQVTELAKGIADLRDIGVKEIGATQAGGGVAEGGAVAVRFGDLGELSSLVVVGRGARPSAAAGPPLHHGGIAARRGAGVGPLGASLGRRAEGGGIVADLCIRVGGAACAIRDLGLRHPVDDVPVRVPWSWCSAVGESGEAVRRIAAGRAMVECERIFRHRRGRPEATLWSDRQPPEHPWNLNIELW